MMKLLALSCLLAAVFASTIPSSRLDKRITGGSNVVIENYPYQVYLQIQYYFTCGGTIISDDWILTAAHCTLYPEQMYTVRAGVTDRKAAGGVTYNVRRIIRHPDFNNSFVANYDYDFALIQTSRTIELGATQAVVALPEQDEDVAAGTIAVNTGWGSIRLSGSYSDRLQAVTLPIVDQDECNADYSGGITDRMICAGVEQGGKGFCVNDQGGPLVADNKLVGIASWWSKDCASPHFPSVFSRVASVRDWIKTVTGV